MAKRSLFSMKEALHRLSGDGIQNHDSSQSEEEDNDWSHMSDCHRIVQRGKCKERLAHSNINAFDTIGEPAELCLKQFQARLAWGSPSVGKKRETKNKADQFENDYLRKVAFLREEKDAQVKPKEEITVKDGKSINVDYVKLTESCNIVDTDPAQSITTRQENETRLQRRKGGKIRKNDMRQKDSRTELLEKITQIGMKTSVPEKHVSNVKVSPLCPGSESSTTKHQNSETKSVPARTLHSKVSSSVNKFLSSLKRGSGTGSGKQGKAPTELPLDEMKQKKEKSNADMPPQHTSKPKKNQTGLLSFGAGKKNPL